MTTKTCPICATEILLKAKKCRYCNEWIDEAEKRFNVDDIDMGDNSTPIVYKPAKDPFQYRIIKKLPFNFNINILIISTTIFFIIFLVWSRLGEDEVYLITFACYAFQMFFAWGGLIWVNKLIINYFPNYVKLIDRNHNISQSQFEKYYKIMFNTRNAVITGIIIGGAAGIGDYFIGPPFETLSAKIMYSVVLMFFMFWVGAASYTLIGFTLLVKNTSLLPMVQAVKYSKSSGVGELGRLHLKSALIPILPFALGVIARLPGNWDLGILTIMWYSGFALIIILYLFVPLLDIHSMMVDDKNKQLETVQQQLNFSMLEVNHNTSSQSLKRFFELRELEKSINEKGTWPFEVKNIAGLFLAVILPVILMILEIVLK